MFIFFTKNFKQRTISVIDGCYLERNHLRNKPLLMGEAETASSLLTKID